MKKLLIAGLVALILELMVFWIWSGLLTGQLYKINETIHRNNGIRMRLDPLSARDDVGLYR